MIYCDPIQAERYLDRVLQDSHDSATALWPSARDSLRRMLRALFALLIASILYQPAWGQ
jgi:hypothetical protein